MTLILLNEIKNLDTEYEPESVDLVSEYWQPEQQGESKRMVFWTIESRKCLDQQGNQIELDCVVFIVPGGDGKHQTFVNGSKRLVGVFEGGEVKQGTPVEVTYRGKKKNRTNSNMSDHWSVVTLKAKVSK